MGGYGSSRWNWHSKRHAVEDGYTLPMKAIHSSLIPYWQGTLTWSRGGEKVAAIEYQVITLEETPSAVRLIYTWSGQDINYIVHLTSTPLPWGGRRYWFMCPNFSCGRRVAKLYLAPGDPHFACRSCHQLTYRSCQEKGGSDSFLKPMTGLMQDIYPGMTVKDMAAFWNDKYTDHMKQILLEKYGHNLNNLVDPYEKYLTVDELCKQSGLSLERFEQLSAIRLLLPDHNERFRPRLLKWAQKLDYLLDHGWKPDEIKRWARGRFQTDNPRKWPPDRADWQTWE